jgi:hypothetical protein
MTRSEISACNQVLYREVNERIEQLTSELFGEQVFEIFCECGQADCGARIEVSVPDYEAVRAHATHFILLRDHQDRQVEWVVWHKDGYLVVENIGRAAEIAEQASPRR